MAAVGSAPPAAEISVLSAEEIAKEIAERTELTTEERVALVSYITTGKDIEKNWNTLIDQLDRIAYPQKKKHRHTSLSLHPIKKSSLMRRTTRVFSAPYISQKIVIGAARLFINLSRMYEILYRNEFISFQYDNELTVRWLRDRIVDEKLHVANRFVERIHSFVHAINSLTKAIEDNDQDAEHVLLREFLRKDFRILGGESETFFTEITRIATEADEVVSHLLTIVDERDIPRTISLQLQKSQMWLSQYIWCYSNSDVLATVHDYCKSVLNSKSSSIETLSRKTEGEEEEAFERKIEETDSEEV